MGKCKNCGKEALPGQEYCMMCKNTQSNTNPNRARHGNSSPGRGREGYSRGTDDVSIPNICLFRDSFYDDDGYLKREIFLEAAEAMARLLQENSMTQTSLRHLFNEIGFIRSRIKSDRNLPLGFIRENLLKFVVHTEYQTRRNVTKECFKRFVDLHKDLAMKDKREFLGFAEYFTSIVARMKQK